MPTSGLLAAHLLTTAAYAGFQWTVQVLVYRQFPGVPREAFPDHEAAHSRRISPLVGVLFGACALSTAGLLAVRPDGVPLAGIVVSAALFATVLVVTATLAVPEHRRLGAGFDADETPDALGEKLVLPPFLEAERAQIEPRLTPLPDPTVWRPQTAPAPPATATTTTTTTGADR